MAESAENISASAEAADTSDQPKVRSAVTFGGRGFSHGGRPRRKRRKFSELPLTVRIVLSFVGVSFLTILVAFAILSVIWGQYFTQYTHDNLQLLATSTATSVAEEYEDTQTWTSDALAPAKSMSTTNPNVSVQVVDNDGIVRYDGTRSMARAGVLGSDTTPVTKPSQFVSAPIMVDDQQVGVINVWVNGSDSLLTSADSAFRKQSYEAMLFALIIAMFLALAVGFVLAQNLVNPINRITRTAKAIKEGDLGARTCLVGEDEVSRLGETFDAMADTIEKEQTQQRRFITDVAHELRTPLMAIQSTVEAMIDGVFEADQERLTTIDAEVQRLSRLVGSLLKLSRLENRKIPMKKQKLNLGVLLEDVASTHEAYVEGEGLKFRFEAQPDVYVYGDPDMLRQATANLISNAVRYTPSGSVMLRVAKGDIMASIAVQDTGIGLSNEEAKMVFDRFWRADEGRNRAQGGLGIGLSVVKEIVDRHNGWVRVEGKKGEGSTFTIFIPLYQERRDAASKKAQAERQDSGQLRLNLRFPAPKERDAKGKDAKDARNKNAKRATNAPKNGKKQESKGNRNV